MCAPGDIHVSYHARDSYTKCPTLFLNDGVPGGLGLSDRVYEMDFELFRRALEAVKSCPCESGCPACIGAAAEGGKKTLISILERLTGGASMKLTRAEARRFLSHLHFEQPVSAKTPAGQVTRACGAGGAASSTIRWTW